MKLLPGYNQNTRRAELAVFLSLEAAMVLAISFAVFEMLAFVSRSDQVAAAFSAQPAAIVRSADCNEEKTSLTNIPTTQGRHILKPAAESGGVSHRHAFEFREWFGVDLSSVPALRQRKGAGIFAE